jgi:predicted nuclease of predicted toxin-antitoxin system
LSYICLAGHDVLWAGYDFPSAGDKDVLERAETEGRILFTLDHDFWQIALQRRERMQKGGLALLHIRVNYRNAAISIHAEDLSETLTNSPVGLRGTIDPERQHFNRTE